MRLERLLGATPWRYLCIIFKNFIPDDSSDEESVRYTEGRSGSDILAHLAGSFQ